MEILSSQLKSPLSSCIETLFGDSFEAASGNGLATGLTHFWALTEASGDRADSESSNPLVPTGGSIGALTGIRGGTVCALLEDGVDAYLRTANISDIFTGSPVSMSLWVYTVNAPPAEPVLFRITGSSPIWSVYLINGGDVYAASEYETDDGSNYTQNPESGSLSGYVGAWMHVASTISEDGMQLYINGAKVESVASSGVMPSVTTRVQLGAVGGFNLDCGMQFLGIWNNRVLTQSDVTALYNSGTGLTRAEMT